MKLYSSMRPKIEYSEMLIFCFYMAKRNWSHDSKQLSKLLLRRDFKIHLLYPHLDVFHPSLGVVSDEYGKDYTMKFL